MNYQATYSPEDNKLRIYDLTGERVPHEDYARLKSAGFVWAPIQKLFVAPSWSPEREDLCIQFAGEIEREESTVAERAEAKSLRLDALASKRATESDAYSRAAHRLLECMVAGQPILVGHHSERKHRKAIEQADRQQEKAIAAADAVSYWMYRATGVERHANRKNKSDVRERRIKVLLAELRDHQRYFNHAAMVLGLWELIKSKDEEKRASLARKYSGIQIVTGPTCSHELYRKLYNDEISVDDFIESCIQSAEAMLSNSGKYRWLQHVLNRLAYERSELGEVPLYEGALTDVIIKAFARENGAYKPVAKKQEDGSWELSSNVPLPAHIADGKTLVISESDLAVLMQSVGYTVPAKKEGPPPIVNFHAESVSVNWYGVKTLRVISMTKAEYNAIYSDYRGVKLTTCGGMRVRVCKNPQQAHLGFSAEWCVAFLTDSKTHNVTGSSSIVFATELVA